MLFVPSEEKDLDGRVVEHGFGARSYEEREWDKSGDCYSKAKKSRVLRSIFVFICQINAFFCISLTNQ